MRIIINDPGESVFCDFCGDDLTESNACGGIQFQSKAACPVCAVPLERDARKYSELHFIRARCPENKTFADWVRQDLR